MDNERRILRSLSIVFFTYGIMMITIGILKVLDLQDEKNVIPNIEIPVCEEHALENDLYTINDEKYIIKSCTKCRFIESFKFEKGSIIATKVSDNINYINIE